MEFIGGVGVNDREGLRRMGVEPAEVAVRGAASCSSRSSGSASSTPIRTRGTCACLKEGVIAPLDYGMFGQLDAAPASGSPTCSAGLLAQDTDRVLRALDALDIRGDHVDSRALRRDAAELVAAYSDLTLDTIDLGIAAEGA